MRDRSAMKRDWDERARENAMHYVASSRDDWTVAEFFDSGRESIDTTLSPVLELVTQGRDPKTLRVLEIGCGLGRMTRHLAELFGEVHGIDVSGEMVARARELLADMPNAYLYETNGEDLGLFRDGFFQYAYSFLVFQHIPFPEVIVNYFRETYRTLEPGSMFMFQVQGIVLPGERDTWEGVGFSDHELREIAEGIGFEVVLVYGEGTQYFWNWWRRPPP